MVSLGNKIVKKTRRLGKKFDGGVHKLGQKTNNVLDKVENINEKVINKSGKFLNTAKKVIGTADKIVGVLNDAGVANVPILGNATSALETGLGAAHKGLNKADKFRDAYAEKSRKALEKGKKVGNALEKHNSRKMLNKLLEDDAQPDESTFV